MKRAVLRALTASALCAWLTGCGNAVSPQGDGGSMSEAGSDAANDTGNPVTVGCGLPGGGTCPRGVSCPAGDGCNTCMCVPGEMFARCTQTVCGSSCNASNPCTGARECVYPVNACGVDGVCSGITDCAAITSFCGCDGTTFQGCPGRPTRPSAREGACLSPVMDAGLSCGDAALTAQGACAYSNGVGAPVECCRGYDCSGRAVCAMVAPTCPVGLVASVVGGCWGPCVPRDRCR
ncbi:MAG: hypothetical protein U0269_31115 [Polyangiales bacterium]